MHVFCWLVMPDEVSGIPSPSRMPSLGAQGKYSSSSDRRNNSNPLRATRKGQEKEDQQHTSKDNLEPRQAVSVDEYEAAQAAAEGMVPQRSKPLSSF